MIDNQPEGFDDPREEIELFMWYKLDANFEVEDMDDFYSMYYVYDEEMSQEEYEQFEKMNCIERTIRFQQGNFFWEKEDAEAFAVKVRSKIAERNNPVVYDIMNEKLLVPPWDDEPEDYATSLFNSIEFDKYCIFGIWIADFGLLMRVSGDLRTNLYDSHLPIPIRIGKDDDFPLQVGEYLVEGEFDGLFATRDEAWEVCKELRAMFHQNMVYVLNHQTTEDVINSYDDE